MNIRFTKNCLVLIVLGLLMAGPWSRPQQVVGQIPDALDLGFDLPLDDDPVVVTGWFSLNQDSRQGKISVQAEIAAGWHLYSITQPKGGPIRARIDVPESEQYTVDGDFEPDSDPHVDEEDPIFGSRVEYHEHKVIWTAPFTIAEGVDPSSLELKLDFDGQTCVFTGSCKPLSESFTATFEGYVAAPVASAKFKPIQSHVLLSGKLRNFAGPGIVKPGGRLTLSITAEPQDGFHIYKQEPTKTDDNIGTPTLFALTKQNEWTVNGPTTAATAIEHLGMQYHEDPVTWEFTVIIPNDATEKTYSLAGVMGFQTCTEQCDPPDAVKFSVDIPVGKEIKSLPVHFTATGDYNKIVDLAAASQKPTKETIETTAEPDVSKQYATPEHIVVEDTPEEIAEMAKLYDPDEKVKYLTYADMDANPIGSGGTSSANQTTFWTAMLGAFLGGMLLNLMPCVFPVLGLKVMGFVKQAGSDPMRIRLHGIVFSLGLVVSMWALAGIIMTIKLAFGEDINWGAQMGNPYFVCAIIVLLFLLGLNMAGVFEVGTSMTSVGGKLQGKSGYMSSFLSGILTTLIATPCSGPFLGAAMSYTMVQPIATAMFLFTIFALGISTPYLLLSFFPSLINKLPRPGEWMDTFRVTMAFALFATVAFFMQAFGGQTGADGLAWLVMGLVVIALAAFYYGKWSEPHEKPGKRIAFGYVMPLFIAGVGAWMCYSAANQRSDAISSHDPGGLAWQNWNPGKIKHSLAKNKRIIWVDYTADW